MAEAMMAGGHQLRPGLELSPGLCRERAVVKSRDQAITRLQAHCAGNLESARAEIVRQVAAAATAGDVDALPSRQPLFAPPTCEREIGWQETPDVFTVASDVMLISQLAGWPSLRDPARGPILRTTESPSSAPSRVASGSG